MLTWLGTSAINYVNAIKAQKTIGLLPCFFKKRETIALMSPQTQYIFPEAYPSHMYKAWLQDMQI